MYCLILPVACARLRAISYIVRRGPRRAGCSMPDHLAASMDVLGLGTLETEPGHGVRVAVWLRRQHGRWCGALTLPDRQTVLDLLDWLLIAFDARRPLRLCLDADGEVRVRIANLSGLFSGD